MRYLERFNEGKSFEPINKRCLIVVSRPGLKEDPNDVILIDLLELMGGSIGHDDMTFTLDWSDGDNQIYKDYLINTYGPDIKNYKDFLLE